jgi:glyoxylase-like metal-dependent hydrolase (beta-lactamase superfamily II)
LVEVTELAPGLWRWTTAHPGWTPEQGGPEGWERDVGSVYCETGGEVVLVDPLVPADEPQRERFWRALDRDVGRAGATHVVLTCEWHARSSADLVARYGADVWSPADGSATLPAGVEAVDAALEDEVLIWLASHRALVAGDTLLGDGAGGIRLCPDSWLGDRDPAAVRAELRERLSGRRVELVLPAHGDAVTDGAADALARSFAA